jgi:two-component system, NtrC family, nitrogen regulation sensor histidine kinase NtrY
MEKKQKNIFVDDKELRRRRRERIIMVVVGLLAVAFTLIASQYSNKGSSAHFHKYSCLWTDQH